MCTCIRWEEGWTKRGGSILFSGSKGVFLFSVRLIAGPVTNHDSSGRERRGHTTLGSVSGACCLAPCGSKRRTLPRNYCALQQRARRGIEEGPLPFIFPLHLPPNSRRFFIRPSSGLSFPVIAIFLFSPFPPLDPFFQISLRLSNFPYVRFFPLNIKLRVRRGKEKIPSCASWYSWRGG